MIFLIFHKTGVFWWDIQVLRETHGFLSTLNIILPLLSLGIESFEPAGTQNFKKDTHSSKGGCQCMNICYFNARLLP